MSGSPAASRGKNRQPLVYTGTPPAETAIACAAAGAFTAAQGGIIEVHQRRLFLWISYTAAAVGGRLSLLPLFACTPTVPHPTADEWFLPSYFDGIPTYAALAGALPAGTDFIATQAFARCDHAPVQLATRASLANNDQIREVISLDVSAARYVQILYAESGVVGTPGSALVRYSLGTG